MILDELNFAELYRQQMQQAGRTTKAPEHWDARAEKMAEVCANPQDPYLVQLQSKIDLRNASTLLDMGCGPGSVCLNLAGSLTRVWGVDYSRGMLEVAGRRAAAMGLQNVTLLNKSWEDDWTEIPECDIAVASRSTLVADLQQALIKLNNKARLRVYTTHTVATSFVDVAVQRAVGRPVVELPNYIFAVNILYQLGIHPKVDYIRGPNCQNKTESFEQFSESVSWSLGTLDDTELQRLFDFYQQKKRMGQVIVPPSRDWALVYWDKTQTL
ncbi:class I SAM-dependent methyltransferase [Shewanella yunxiaonensis]|uniref:Class I SAM-dependent methyltransferase n=1 Tax=Shewanella yunxiaonensis TaxID=2829809 RepID=A0ABX7YRG5_9GAMM|nr:class I SAM-dependent methyltransferase [Shewanella yunxiaonensis]QUN05373.1 class I SAM-dependent methyltransferase [Shewanella yunxiaonensis]